MYDEVGDVVFEAEATGEYEGPGVDQVPDLGGEGEEGEVGCGELARW